MVIGIDIRVLSRGTRSGIEEYALNLLSHLLPMDKTIEYKLFYNAYRKVDIDHEWAKLPNVRIINHSIPNRFFDLSSRFFSAPKVDKLLGGVDVFWSPHIFLAALSNACPAVVTFHDLSFERYGEFYSWQKHYWHFSMNPRLQARKAKKIIAVSESTKQDLVELYEIPAAKIKVIYSGINSVSDKGFGSSQIKEKYHLPEKYILYLGTIEPRKNIIGLIKAFELFKKKYGLLIADYKLVIAGAKGWLYQDVFKAAEKSSFKNDIIFTGFIDNEDKNEVYRLSSLYVYPSFFEGFGFPPLEAMAQGVPVITSNTSSEPEAVATAALVIDPYNIDEMAWAMNELLINKDLRVKMIGRGYEQIKRFSWQRCARETLEVLKEVNKKAV